MRTRGSSSPSSNRWLLTPGILDLTNRGAEHAAEAVRTFEAFNSDNDPHGEHDFGSFDLNGERVLWKIDYYNLTLDGGSPDPADEAVTVRVLTIMLALEY
jgi:hypothetical protein